MLNRTLRLIFAQITFQSTHIELEVADPAVIKVRTRTLSAQLVTSLIARQEVTTSRARFPKPVKFYSALSFFGPNIIVSEGDEWKRYRKIAAPAFSEVRERFLDHSSTL